jgi:hypothetical protein
MCDQEPHHVELGNILNEEILGEIASILSEMENAAEANCDNEITLKEVNVLFRLASISFLILY